eukprot:4356682-Pyramimonas_sp.AAC.1
MMSEGQFCLETTDSFGNKVWVCPKYQGGDYNEEKFKRIFEALSPTVAPSTRDEAWRYLKMRFGDGPDDFDAKQILYYTRHYTLVTLYDDGELVDMHQDFIIRGQTEHTIALQHHLEYEEHLPDVRPRGRKRGKPSTIKSSEKHRRGAGRGHGRRPRGQPALGSAASRAVAPAAAEPVPVAARPTKFRRRLRPPVSDGVEDVDPDQGVKLEKEKDLDEET